LADFLRKNPEMVNSKLCNDSTNTMCRACFLGYKNIVVVLVRHGADVNQCSDKGRSPLMWAVYRNHTHVVDFLLENGADVNICDNTGLNAFELATTIVHY
jgi:ankyrin repeat protein